MPPLRFHELAEAKHLIQNPLNPEKLAQVRRACGLQPVWRVLDLACGRGYLLVNWAVEAGIGGLGVDVSKAFLEVARQRAQKAGVQKQVAFEEGDAASYPADGQTFDVVSCVGAAWIGGGTVGTLERMKRALNGQPHNRLVFGDVYWTKPPTDEIAAALGLKPDEAALGMTGLLDRFASANLKLIYAALSSPDDWDQYNAQQWLTAHHWLKANPDDPDAAEFAQWIAASQRTYFQYERDYLNWGLFVLAV